MRFVVDLIVFIIVFFLAKMIFQDSGAALLAAAFIAGAAEIAQGRPAARR